MNSVYILSGLGVDERVFTEMDFSGLNVTHIHWETPYKNETIQSYAEKLIKQIKTHNPILIGLSFGGMMAIEIGKKIKTERIILLASVKTKHEIPRLHRFLGQIGILKVIPVSLLKSTNFIAHWLFGTESTSDRVLLKQILADTDPVFIKWALYQILHWKNIEIPLNVKHIHGTKDRLLPIRLLSCDIKINGAGHFMTVNRAMEVSKAIKLLLEWN